MPEIELLIQQFLCPLVPGPTLESFLEAVENPAARAGDLATIVDANQAYSHFLRKLDLLQPKLLQWQEEESLSTPGGPGVTPEVSQKILQEIPKTQKIIALLGQSATRNVIVAASLNRARGLGLPRLVKDKTVLAPKKQLRFALFAENLCEDKSWAYAPLAFRAGLHFDGLAAIIDDQGAPLRVSKVYLEEAWKEALKTAQIAYVLGSRMKKFKWASHVFASALLIASGKVLMSIAFPNWTEFHRETAKLEASAGLFLELKEKKLFPATHAEMGALFMSFSRDFRSTNRAVLHYQKPEFLMKSDPELAQLAWILNLASSLSVSKNPTLLNLGELRGLKALGLKATELELILRSAGI